MSIVEALEYSAKELQNFINELAYQSDQIEKKDKLITAKLFMMGLYVVNESTRMNAVKSFYTWIMKNKERIDYKDESLFAIDTLNEEQEVVEKMNEIKSLWPSLTPDAKDTVWEWMEYFVVVWAPKLDPYFKAIV
jgi:hypothetical protein